MTKGKFCCSDCFVDLPEEVNVWMETSETTLFVRYVCDKCNLKRRAEAEKKGGDWDMSDWEPSQNIKEKYSEIGTDDSANSLDDYVILSMKAEEEK